MQQVKLGSLKEGQFYLMPWRRPGAQVGLIKRIGAGSVSVRRKPLGIDANVVLRCTPRPQWRLREGRTCPATPRRALASSAAATVQPNPNRPSRLSAERPRTGWRRTCPKGSWARAASNCRAPPIWPMGTRWTAAASEAFPFGAT